jgi:chromosome partitioning protein
MRTISIINQKGGCGKTTTAINLAASLALQKRRVLVIDLDSQGHASLGLNLKPEEVARGMTEVLTQGTYLDDVIYESISANLDLAPANITLSAVEQLLADAAHKEKKLLGAIQKMKKTYDYVIIDSPPNLGILTFNALRASDLAIVPVDMGYFSLHGLQKLKEIAEVLGRHTGHFVKLRALGIMVNVRNKFAQEVLEELKKDFDGHLFGTLIRNSVRLREASKHGVPVIEYAPNSAGAQDYLALAQEVIAMEAVSTAPGHAIETLLPTVPGVTGDSNHDREYRKEV